MTTNPKKYIESSARESIYLKGATARLDDQPRESSYSSQIFTKAFFDGWDDMDRAIWNNKLRDTET